MAKPRRVDVTCAAPSTSTFMPSQLLPDRELLRPLHCQAIDLSVVEKPAPFLHAAFASVARRSNLLSAAFEDLLLCGSVELARSSSLCLHEVLLVLKRFKAVVVDCCGRSRTFLLLQSDEIATELRELHHELAMLLDLLPLLEPGLGEDIMDLLALASRQCRRSSSSSSSSSAKVDAQELKASVLSLIDEIEREIVPGREQMEQILEELGINDLASCTNEIDSLEREITEQASEPVRCPADSMITLVGLVRFAKCVIFSITPRPPDSISGAQVDFNRQDSELAAPPLDLRCPISLDLMHDPVVAASGQTYDRESIDRWFQSGKSTCPRTGQLLANLELVPNKSLKNLISIWCRDNSFPTIEVCQPSKRNEEQAPNKAALEMARMTASFLVNKLSTVSFSPDTASPTVHEIQLFSNSSSHNCAMVGDADIVPMLVPLLYSEDAGLQLNAMTTLLNLSILEANKKRIMHAHGAVEAVIHIMCSGATWRSKENAAATVLNLASVQIYSRCLGRDTSVVEKLAHLARIGPASTKRDALAALLSLAGETKNVPILVDVGVPEAALSAMRNHDDTTAAAVLAALAKRGGAESIIKIDGAVPHLVEEMRHDTEWARESAAATPVLLCRHLGAQAVTQVMAVPAVERAIWELMDSGTDRARRKAASLGRICWGYCIGPPNLILME